MNRYLLILRYLTTNLNKSNSKKIIPIKLLLNYFNQKLKCPELALKKRFNGWKCVAHIDSGASIPISSREFLMVILALSTIKSLKSSLSDPITGTDL